MTKVKIKTGKSRKELEKFYISSINALMKIGVQEESARMMVQSAMKQTIKQL